MPGSVWATHANCLTLSSTKHHQPVWRVGAVPLVLWMIRVALREMVKAAKEGTSQTCRAWEGAHSFLKIAGVCFITDPQQVLPSI